MVLNADITLPAPAVRSCYCVSLCCICSAYAT